MAPPKTPEDVVAAIELLWAENPKQSALKVWGKYHAYTGSPSPAVVSGRRVQQIIAAAKKRKSTGRVYPLVEWRPWRNETESRDDASYLLRLDAISMATFGRHLYQHEAKWARRLRTAIESLSPWLQYVIAGVYAGREVAAYFLEEQRPYTADLDGILAYMPWETENKWAYQWAVVGGAVPYPLVFGPEDAKKMVDATYALMKNEGESDSLREKTRYWNFAQRMVESLPRRPHHLDKEKFPFREWSLQAVLNYWSGEWPELVAAPGDGIKKENHEGLDQTQE